MISRTIARTIAVGVTTLVVIIVVYLSLSKKHTQVPTREANTLDSLKFTQPTFHAMIDTLVLRETTYVRSVDTLLRTISRFNTTGNVLHTTADSLAALAVTAHHASDSAVYWHRAYDVRTLESDTLRRALSVAITAQQEERLARTAADQRADATQQRLQISETLNARLAQDIGRAIECKFLWMRCPSRKAVLATGILMGAGMTFLVEQQRRNP